MVTLSFPGPRFLYLKNGRDHFLLPVPVRSWGGWGAPRQGREGLGKRKMELPMSRKPQAVAESLDPKLPGCRSASPRKSVSSELNVILLILGMSEPR